VPTLITKYHEEQTVAKVVKAYSSVAQAWNRYQMENSCMGKVSKCFDETDSHGNQEAFQKRFVQYFNNVQRISTLNSTTDIAWLPDKAYHLDGSLVTQSWMGVHKYTGTENSAYFTVTDGTIYHIQMPDNYKESGFIFIDTNGKKGPNRIGKDQFPIGIGAYNNPVYAEKVHPYYAEDENVNKGLCNVRNNNMCNPDECTQENCSPTAYVLKNKKLPHINW